MHHGRNINRQVGQVYSPVLRYVGWSNCDEQAELELEKFFSFPAFFHPETVFGEKTWFFLGTPGYGAPSHIDQVTLPSWQAQVHVHSNCKRPTTNALIRLGIF